MSLTRSTYIFVYALGLSLAPACGDDDDDHDGGGGRESVQALCQQACTTAAGLSCPGDDDSTCVGDCELLEDVPEACLPAARTALECIAERPVSDWTCDADGESVLQDGLCNEEGNALLVCVLGETEDGTCPFEEDDECDDPTGTALCPAGTDQVDCA